jgi:hypothetical protein
LALLGRTLGFHEKAMFLSWSSLVSSWMKTGKWPLEYAIFIDCMCQMNTIQDFNNFLPHNNLFSFFSHFHWFIENLFVRWIYQGSLILSLEMFLEVSIFPWCFNLELTFQSGMPRSSTMWIPFSFLLTSSFHKMVPSYFSTQMISEFSSKLENSWIATRC